MKCRSRNVRVGDLFVVTWAGEDDAPLLNGQIWKVMEPYLSSSSRWRMRNTTTRRVNVWYPMIAPFERVE